MSRSRCTCHDWRLGDCPIHGTRISTRKCALCQRLIADERYEMASDGEAVHEWCEAEYETNIYFRSIEEPEPSDAP